MKLAVPNNLVTVKLNMTNHSSSLQYILLQTPDCTSIHLLKVKGRSHRFKIVTTSPVRLSITILFCEEKILVNIPFLFFIVPHLFSNDEQSLLCALFTWELLININSSVEYSICQHNFLSLENWPWPKDFKVTAHISYCRLGPKASGFKGASGTP
jgi:hypothetical protein